MELERRLHTAFTLLSTRMQPSGCVRATREAGLADSHAVAGPLSLAMAVLVGLGCGEADPSRHAELPPGLWLGGEKGAWLALAETAAALEGSAAGREGAQLRDALEALDCAEVVAQRTPSGEGGAGDVRFECAGPEPSLPALLSEIRAERGASLIAARADAERIHFIATAQRDASASLTVDVEFAAALATGALALAIPSEEAPAPSELNGDDRLLHMHLRPRDGLDLSALASAGGQGDEMFGLRDRLFSRAVLGGSWELAVYLPREAQGGQPPSGTPGVALALELANASIAAAALDAFVERLTRVWPIRRSPLDPASLPASWRQAFDAACFPGLRILPELAPCWAARDESLVIAWNRATLQHALEGSRSAAPASSSLQAELAHFEEADERLRTALAPASLPVGLVYPWQRLRVTARARDAGDRIADGVALRLDASPAVARLASRAGAAEAPE